jgi:hypothetical protein
MRILINERQYRVLLKEDKIENAKNKFVFTDDILNTFLKKMKLRRLEDQSDEKFVIVTSQSGDQFKKPKERIDPIVDNRGYIIAYKIVNKRGKMSVKFTEEIFNDIVNADPSRGKKYIQWIIGIAMNFINEENEIEFIRFVTEDLDTVTDNLTSFDDIKDTGTFKRRMKNYSVAEIREDPSDIFKYSLSNLYKVMGIFQKTEGVYGNMKQKMEEHVATGSAKYIYEDDDVLIYEPLTRDSSCDPFSPITNVCVSNPGNSYFKRYSVNNKQPDGNPSRYYYIVPKALQYGKNAAELGEKDYTQYYPLLFHFESNQLHDRHNAALKGYENISSSRGYSNYSVSDLFNEFPGVKKFLSRELGGYVSMDIKSGNSLMNVKGNKYGSYLNLFGGSLKDYVSEEDYEEGVEQIKKLAKDNNKQHKEVKDNKYLMWLLENEDDFQFSDYITKESYTLPVISFSDIKLARVPDLSHLSEKVTQIRLNNCGLTEIPDPSLLPPNLFAFNISNNDITSMDFTGYENHESIKVINMQNNPTNSINLNSVQLLLSVPKFRLIFPNLEENIKNDIINMNLAQEEEEQSTIEFK